MFIFSAALHRVPLPRRFSGRLAALCKIKVPIRTKKRVFSLMPSENPLEFYVVRTFYSEVLFREPFIHCSKQRFFTAVLQGTMLS